VNVTLLFSYLAAAEAYLEGVERRIADGLDPAVGSVASVFMSRWDAAVAKELPADLVDKLGLAVGLDVYRAYRRLMSSDRFQGVANDGARMQHLLWASTSTKDAEGIGHAIRVPAGRPYTVNTMPGSTLEAFFDHGEAGDPLPADGGDADATLGRFAGAGVDTGEVAARLQRDGARSFVDAWNELMDRIRAQASAVA
jgi:transaldolase